MYQTGLLCLTGASFDGGRRKGGREHVLPLKKRKVSSYQTHHQEDEGEEKEEEEEEEEKEEYQTVLPLKKRISIHSYKCEEDQEKEKRSEVQYEGYGDHERLFPLKKRMNLYSFHEWNDQQEEKIPSHDHTEEGIEEENKIIGDEEAQEVIREEIIEDENLTLLEEEEKIQEEAQQVGEEMIQEEENQMIEEEGNEELNQVIGEEKYTIEEEEEALMGTQVTNPISLIAITASWLTEADELLVMESEENNVPALTNNIMRPIPQAYALLDRAEVLLEEGDGDNMEIMQPIVELEINGDVVLEGIEKKAKRLTKPRSKGARRPKSSYNFQTFLNVDSAVIISEDGDEEDQSKEYDADHDDDDEEEEEEEDLYSKVKKR